MIRRAFSALGGLGVVAVSAAVFVAAFLLLQSVAAASRPPEIDLLAAARDLPAGTILAESDLRVIRAFRDEASAAFVAAEEITRTVGGMLALPLREGSPVPRDALIAPSGTRLSALLSEEPGAAAFPLFLDEPNVVAPPVEAFLPGDIVGILAVVAQEPSRPEAPPSPELSLLPTPAPRPAPQTPTPAVTATAPITMRVPVAKSLFPGGIRVLAVIAPRTDPELGTTSGRPTLVLRVPAAELERLALLLQQADRVFVAPFGKGEGFPERTPAFTFDDFIEQLREDRQRMVEEKP